MAGAEPSTASSALPPNWRRSAPTAAVASSATALRPTTRFTAVRTARVRPATPTWPTATQPRPAPSDEYPDHVVGQRQRPGPADFLGGRALRRRGRCHRASGVGPDAVVGERLQVRWRRQRTRELWDIATKYTRNRCAADSVPRRRRHLRPRHSGLAGPGALVDLAGCRL